MRYLKERKVILIEEEEITRVRNENQATRGKKIKFKMKIRRGRRKAK